MHKGHTKFFKNPLPLLPEDERIYFNIHYMERDIAKMWHCRFDPQRKLWFTGCLNSRLKLLVAWFEINEVTSLKARKLMQDALEKYGKQKE